MRQASSTMLTGVTLLVTSSRTLAQAPAPGALPADPAVAPEGGLADWWWVILLGIVVIGTIWYLARRRRAP